MKILIVDDNERTLEAIQLELDSQCEVTTASDSDTAMNLVTHQEFDVVLADYNLGNPDINGLHIFRRARLKNSFVSACLMTGSQSSPLMKEIFDTFNGLLLEKPFKDGAIDDLLRLGNISKMQRLELESQNQSNDLFSGLVAETPAMHQLIEQIKRCSRDSDLRIHMAGPSGTGKSTFAEIIHKLSNLKGKFVSVNCSELGETAISQLFGHMKGSFSGSVGDHTGFIAEANGGTLFLDEFHLLSKDVQGKLLRVLQHGIYRPLGGKNDLTSNFRLVTAASENLQRLADENTFSRDLWNRVSGIVLEVPSLAERKACIPKLVYRRLTELGKSAKQNYEIDSNALDLIISFSWNANLHALRNSLQAICAQLMPSQRISAEMVRNDLKKRSGTFVSHAQPTHAIPGESLREACKRFEKSLIAQAMNAHKGNTARAAKALGIPRETLRYKYRTVQISG
jgi:DNA-binding NtrC family response regulator